MIEQRPLMEIRGLCKRYEIGAGKASGGRRKVRELWALRDIDLDVARGQTLGIVGRNGAGKTTLLRVLSRVTAPTAGSVAGAGRVFPMLELGVSFHEDLSVEENIRLNGAMFDVPRREVERRLADILDFADAGDCLGRRMGSLGSSEYIRIAFSAAIGMAPDLLLADEVLAVGDEEFRKQCLLRLEQEKSRGMTVLFVSHDMRAITEICDQVLWLDGGRIRMLGSPRDVVAQYEHALLAGGARSVDVKEGTARVEPVAARLVGATGEELAEFVQSAEVRLELYFEVAAEGALVAPGVDVYCEDVLVMSFWGEHAVRVNGGRITASVAFPPYTFAARTYKLKSGLSVMGAGGETLLSAFPQEVTLSVHGAPDVDLDGSLRKRQRIGYVAHRLKWRCDRLDVAQGRGA